MHIQKAFNLLFFFFYVIALHNLNELYDLNGI